MCKLATCCFACSLKTGAKVAAKLTALEIVYLFAAIVTYTAVDKAVYLPKTGIDIVEFTPAYPLAIAGIYLAGLVMALISVVYITLGVLMERPEYILLWLVITVVQVTLCTIAAIFGVLGGDVVAIPMVVIGVLMIYLWLVTANFYYQITREEECQKLCE